MIIRLANISDLDELAKMNLQLIQDESHRNPMGLSELSDRMAAWLDSEYSGAVFEDGHKTIGYALWREEDEYLYIRQFFIEPDRRREGLGAQAIDFLKEKYWRGNRLRLEVLAGNTRAQSFWRAVGFSDYCITMENTDE